MRVTNPDSDYGYLCHLILTIYVHKSSERKYFP